MNHIFWLVSFVGVCLGLGAIPGTAQTLDHSPVTLTVSGGVSLGSYQAGLSWALVQAVRHSTEAAERPGDHPLHDHPYELVATTGASAGNVNALLAAVEWCSGTSRRAPEESLFWKVWVWTGWDQLLPHTAYDDVETSSESVFHREFFKTHYEEIRKTMAEATPTRPCEIPIGLTLTKLLPGSIQLGPMPVPTQRFVTALVLRGEASRPGLWFEPADRELMADATLGKRIFPPVEEGTVLLDSLVFDLNEASSAFPLAFQPKDIHYLDPESDSAAAAENRCDDHGDEVHLCAAFLDGGVFDNSPIDLAFRLFERTQAQWLGREAVASTPRPNEEPYPRILYVDAGNLREPLRSKRGQRASRPEGRGLGAALQMVKEAVPAARKYELHALARSLREAEDAHRADWIRVSDRAYPLIGEQLGAFAGFLGRPFREYDFYVGVYDALRLLAAERCSVERTQEKVQRVGEYSCIPEQLKQLIEDPDLELGPYAPGVAAVVFKSEFPGAPVPNVGAPLGDTGRPAVLKALLEANRRLMVDGIPDCKTRTIIENLLCSGGFGSVLGGLRENPAANAAIQASADQEQCATEEWKTSSQDCLADKSLGDLVENPELWTSDVFERVIRQLWRVEHSLKSAGAPNRESLIELVEFIFRSGGYRYQLGLDFDPSTIPGGAGTGAYIAKAVPFYAQIAGGTKGSEFGYRPTLHFSRFGSSLSLVVPFGAHYVRPVEQADEAWRLRTGAGVLLKFSNLFVPAVQLTYDNLHSLNWSPTDTRNRTLHGASFNAYLFGGKLTTGLRYIHDNRSEAYSGDDFAFMIGVADLNGLLYWTGRLLK